MRDLFAPAPIVGGLLPLTQHLDTNGDGTGTTNANGTYTLGDTDGVFYITPPLGEIYYINDLHVFIEDASIQGDQYGGVTALTNGVLLEAITGVTTHDLLAGEPVTANTGWLHILHDATMYEFAGGAEFLVAAQNFPSSYGGHLVLQYGDSLRIVCQDTLTGLVDHEFMVQGLRLIKAVLST